MDHCQTVWKKLRSDLLKAVIENRETEYEFYDEMTFMSMFIRFKPRNGDYKWNEPLFEVPCDLEINQGTVTEITVANREPSSPLLPKRRKSTEKKGNVDDNLKSVMEKNWSAISPLLDSNVEDPTLNLYIDDISLNDSSDSMDINNVSDSPVSKTKKRMFLLSLLPEIDEFTEREMKILKAKALELIKDVKCGFIKANNNGKILSKRHSSKYEVSFFFSFHYALISLL